MVAREGEGTEGNTWVEARRPDRGGILPLGMGGRPAGPAAVKMREKKGEMGNQGSLHSSRDVSIAVGLRRGRRFNY
jgi:hypothetical protein